MKFISYDGDWPNLCRGTLVVEKDGNQYSIYGALISGGWCGFDPDGEDQVEEGPWIIDPDELPNELKMIMILPSWKSWLTPTCRMAAAVGVCKEIGRSKI